MKLWKKISLICSGILIIIVTLCVSILLLQTKEKILSLTYEQVADKLKRLSWSFEETANDYFSVEDSEAVAHSLLHYCFSHVADASAVLRVGEKTIYSYAAIRPEDYLTLEPYDEQQRFSGEIDGRQFLIMGSTVRLNKYKESLCAVYLVEDITPVYERVTRLLWQFVLIGAGCILMGMLLIIFLMRRSLRPLAELQAATVHMAAGNYQERTMARSQDEVGMLAASFNRMAETVEQHISELNERAERQQLFIGGVTHEFKTPLTAILLHADTLQNTYMDEEERMALLASIERQCKWLEGLVQKLLKLITLEQSIERKEASIPKLFACVRESVEETLRSRGVALEMQCGTKSLYLDAGLMQSALVNLIDNAGKASAPGQTVTLAAYDHVLEVRDQGTGMEREELGRVTEPFYMADRSRSKKQGGVGLGLALVKEIVKAHEGSLEIESTPGQGTTVRIRLQQ